MTLHVLPNGYSAGTPLPSQPDDADRFETPEILTERVAGDPGAIATSAEDELKNTGTPAESGQHGTQLEILLDIASAADLFHSLEEVAFADIENKGRRETWPLQSSDFQLWLRRRFFEETGGAPSLPNLQAVLSQLTAKARFQGAARPVCLRIGELDGRLYLDLGDDAWRAVEIDPTGWRVIERPPVRFQRTKGMRPLPIPERGGSIDKLRSFLNVRSDADFVLAVSWLLAGLRSRGPYPVLVVSGEQGSAKSTFTAMLRALLDPNVAPLRALPSKDRDLFISASNGHVLAFDNVSGLPSWLSDTLCRLATGGGFAVRKLHADKDEVLFSAARPIVLNGIEDCVTRADLADRAVFLQLQPISEEQRRPEADLWADFDAERGGLLGVLLDALVEGLKRLPETHLSKLPRMADFARWATACETAFWPGGTFLAAYDGNQHAAIEDVLDADPVAASLRVAMQGRAEWTGTASDLLSMLDDIAGERTVKSTGWPRTPRALSGKLRRAETLLRKKGIQFDFIREGKLRTRTIQITVGTPGTEEKASLPSAVWSEDAGKAASDTRHSMLARIKGLFRKE
jgi:hypothetical protein